MKTFIVLIIIGIVAIATLKYIEEQDRRERRAQGNPPVTIKPATNGRWCYCRNGQSMYCDKNLYCSTCCP